MHYVYLLDNKKKTLKIKMENFFRSCEYC